VFNKVLRVKEVRGMEVCLQKFLRLTLDRSERSATRIDRLTPQEIAPNTYPVIRGRFCPTVCREVVEKGKIAPHARNLESGSPLFQPLAKMIYYHPAKSSHLNSLNASAVEFLRYSKLLSSPKRQYS